MVGIVRTQCRTLSTLNEIGGDSRVGGSELLLWYVYIRVWTMSFLIREQRKKERENECMVETCYNGNH